MKRNLLFVAALAWGVFGSAALARAQGNSPVPGWRVQNKANGARTFSPPDVRAGEVFSVTVYEPQTLGEQSADNWLRSFAGAVGSKPGQLQAPLRIEPMQGKGFGASGVYRGPNGTQLGAAFFAFCLDGEHVYAVRQLSSSGATAERYKAQTLALIGATIRRAGVAANGGNAAATAPATPQAPSGLQHTGGALVPGVYAGDQMNDSGSLRFRLRVYLYANGEFRICNEKDVDYSDYDDFEGRYAYSRAMGRLRISDRFDLKDFPDGGQSCIFGRDASGKPTIVAENEPLGVRVTLRYAGPPTRRRSPSAEAAFRGWRAGPGRGLSNTQIAAIVLDSKIEGANEVQERVFLLLRDGTIHADLPVPPDQLDVAQSRRGEPSKWGRWRRAGNGYQVAWRGQGWAKLPGEKVLSAPPGTRLSGYFGTGRSNGLIGMGGSWSLWGVKFLPGARFSKSRSGGYSGGNMFGAAPSVDMFYDDKGSSVAVGGAAFGGGVRQGNRNPNADREGTYSIQGYTLTLRYDNGMVARWPFFFVNTKHDVLWFEDATLGFNPEK